MLKLIATRLRSSGVTVVVISTAYLPRDRYWVLSLLLGLFEQAAVEDAALSQANLLERVAQLVLVELFLPDEIDLGDGGTLDHRNHEDIALGLEAHILEEAGGVERLDRLGSFLFGQSVADLDRQIAEDGSRLGALDTLDTDVLYLKGLEG